MIQLIIQLFDIGLHIRRLHSQTALGRMLFTLFKLEALAYRLTNKPVGGYAYAGS